MKPTDSASRTTAIVDPPLGIDIDIAAIAEVAMGRGGVVGGPHLAKLSADALELDLSDPSLRQFGDYELLEQIGEGGMGVVYRAHQHSLDREVAVKLLAAGPWASREFIERFRREAQHAARMQHPNIVTIYEVSDAEGLHFFSMRLVHGGSLAGLIRREGTLVPTRAAQLLRPIAEAVDYAHRLGVLHLDLKPANVLLDETGTPHVADFGLARRLEQGLTAGQHEISGTPSYMAPEQVTAGTQMTAATDVWGLGAILYELVTGQPPYLGDTPQNTLKRVLSDPLRNARELAPRVPRDLAAIIAKCMAREPHARYPSARELADDLGRFLDNRAVRARPLNAIQRMTRWMQREPRLAGAVGAVFLVLGAGVVETTVQWRRADSNAKRAEATRHFLVDIFAAASPDQNHGQPFTAQQLLERGEKNLERIPQSAPALQADLLGTIGKLYWDLGVYDRAEPLLQRALDMNHDGDVPDPIAARNLLAMADVDTERERNESATARATQALQLATRAGADAASEAADARQLLAQTAIDEGRPAEGEQAVLANLEKDRVSFGEPSAQVASDKLLIGYAELQQSHFREAIAPLQEAIAMNTLVHGPLYSENLAAGGFLADAYSQMGDFAKAEQTQRDVGTTTEKIYGPEHRETLTAKGNWMVMLEAQGRYAEALTARSDMLPALRKISADHPEMLGYAYRAMADDEIALDRFNDAEASARDAIAAWKTVQGQGNDLNSYSSWRSMAAALQYQGRYAEAETAFERALEIQRAHGPAKSAWIHRTEAELGVLHDWQHQFTRASGELQHALDQVPEEDALIHAGIQAELAEAQLHSAAIDDAERNATAALALIRKSVAKDSIQLAMPLHAMGLVSYARGNYAESEADARQMLALETRVHPAAHPLALEAGVLLAQSLAAEGKRDEADKLRNDIEPELRALRTPYATDLLTELEKSKAHR